MTWRYGASSARGCPRLSPDFLASLEGIGWERPANVVTTEPVVMELLAGAANDRVCRQLEILTDGLLLLSIDATLDYRDAALVYRAAPGRGLTVRRPASVR